MNKTPCGEILLTDDEAVDVLLSGGDSTVIVSQETHDTLAALGEYYGLELPQFEVASKLTPAIFDSENQNEWFIPEPYLSMDMATHLLSLCKTDVQRDRVIRELELFNKTTPMCLNLMHYVVETMRAAGVVWGVGRGSSVASYCLFLLGVHKIDAIKYGLDPSEFFKQE